MKIQCPGCGLSGTIDLSKRPPGANVVRCPRCSQSIPLPPSDTAVTSPSSPDAAPPPAAAPSPPPVRPVSVAPSPPLAEPSPATPPEPAPHALCTMCGADLPRDEMVRFGSTWVCASCKNDYVEMLKTGAPPPGGMRYAGFWIRFVAKVVDSLILGAVSWVVTILLSLVTAQIFMSGTPDVSLAFGVAALQFALQIGVAVTYATYFVGKHRATPGKMACGLVVATPDGGAVSYGRAAGRYFGELLSSFTLGIGYLMVAFDEEKRALHDRICTTRVVYR